jgi:outer membrane protein assembly factor BamB
MPVMKPNTPFPVEIGRTRVSVACRRVPQTYPKETCSAILCAGLLAGASALSSAAAEGHWPQWRGPAGNGVAVSANPPTVWSETNNVNWKVKIPGSGAATPIVWGNQVFVQTAIPTGKKVEPAADRAGAFNVAPQVAGLPQAPAAPPTDLPPGQRRRGGPGGSGGFGGRGGGGERPTEFHEFVLLCIDRQTGKTLWQRVATNSVPHEGHHRDHGYASHSPVTDGKFVFAWFGSRGLHCYDMSGKLQWSQDFGDQRTAAGFGEGGSPALFGDTLIVNWDHEGEDFITALDKKSGKALWKESRDEHTSWSTPFIVEHNAKAQIITAASGKVRSYDPANGKVLWECAGLGSNVIPTPVAGDGMLFAMSGHQRPALLAIKLGRTGDLSGTDAIAWKIERETPYVSSSLLLGDSLYFFSRTSGRLSCYEAKTGRPRYEATPIEAISNPGVYASLVAAAGRIYLVGRNGATVVIKHSEKLEVLATNKLDEKFEASPAVVGRELFLRGHENLYCVAEK